MRLAWGVSLLRRLGLGSAPAVAALPPAPAAFRIGGRLFEFAAVTTVEQDDWLATRVLEFELDRAGPQLELPSEERALAMSREILLRIHRSGRGCELLTGAWVERGVPWTPAWAETTARFFGKISDPVEKALLRAQLVQVVMGFFGSGDAWRRTFRPSSTRPPLWRRCRQIVARWGSPSGAPSFEH